MRRSVSNALRHPDVLLSGLLALWAVLLWLDPAPPLGGPWWRPFDFLGALLGFVLLLRRSAALMRPAAAVALVTLFWALWCTPEPGSNPQAGQLVLAAAVFLAALASPSSAALLLQRSVLLLGGVAVLLTLACELGGYGAWLASWWNMESHYAAGWRRWAGPTPHPNLLAYVCALTLWAGIAHPWSGRGWERGLAVAVGAMLGFVAFATLGRVGWLLLVGTALLGGLWRLRTHPGGLRSAVPALLLAVSTLAAFGGAALARPDLISGRLASVQRQVSPTPEILLGDAESNILSRGNVYRDALDLIAEAPWTGHGLAAYERLGEYDALHTHALPLELLLVGGVPLLLLVVGGLVCALVRGQGAFLRGMILLALASGVADNFLFFKGPLVLLALSAGLALHRARGAVLRSSSHKAWTMLRTYRQVLLIFAALAVAYQLREDYSIDFHAYYGAVRWHDETGQAPYEAWEGSVFTKGDTPLARFMREHQTERVSQALRFLYPPTALLQLRAFTWPDDPATAARLWRLFNLVLLGVALALLLARIPRVARVGTATPLCLLIGSYEPLRDALWLGQVSLWIGVLMAGYVWALEGRRPVLAGMLLAVATALKVYPAFWLLLVLMYPGRAWRALLAFAACLGAMVLLALWIDGVDMWPAYARDVLLRMGEAPPPGGVTLYPIFQFAAVPWIGRAVPLVVLALSALAAWRMRHASAQRKARTALAITAANFLVMPLVWQHYLVLIVLLLAAVALRGWGGTASRMPLVALWVGAIYVLTGQMWAVDIVTGFETPNYSRAGLMLAVVLPWVYPLALRLRRNRATA